MKQPDSIVRDSHFEEIAEVRTDSKNRISLGKRKGPARPNFYKVYQNSMGQIVLDPQVTIPAHEQWLFRNADAAKLVKVGLEDAKKGRLLKSRENFSKYTDKE